MSAIKLSEIPLEVPDTLTKTNEMGVRLTEVLKLVSFPGRENVIISLEASWPNDSTLRMYAAHTDTKDGAPIALQHGRRLNSNMDDKELARQVYIMIVQYQVHEYMENFRYGGKILFDPHDEGRNEVMFEAVEKTAQYPEPKVESNPYSVVRIEFIKHVPEPEPQKEMTPFEKAKAKREEQKKAFSKFGAKDWRDKKRAA